MSLNPLALVRRHVALTLAGLLAMVPVLAGCDLNSLIGGGGARCSAYQEKPKSGASTPLLLVLLDLSSNSAGTGQQVATAVQPYLQNALDNGAYVKLLSSGGVTGTKSFPCFTGTTPYLVERNNSNRETKDKMAAATALQTEVVQDVQQTPVSSTGSITALLGAANDDIKTLKATPGVSISDVTVLVWSNLLGTGVQGDCMAVDGQQASVEIAEGIVKRCFDTQLSPITGAKIRFLGVNQGDLTPAQQDMARYLRAELCRRLSSDCS